ncbi:CoxG family protein [Actinophytocola sediminis]
MKLASEFSVPAAPDKVFSLFFDPDTMRGCIPGCEELERVDEKTYRGTLVNEIAHVRFAAGFSAAIQTISEDTATKEVTAVLRGEDRRLGSSIKIDARLAVRPDGEDSVIGYEMDMALWGKLGRLGEPIIRRRSREVELEFARSLAIACGAPAEKLPATKKARPAVPAAATTSPAAPTRGTDAVVVADPTTRGLALAAVIVSVVALLTAVLRRGR